MFFIRRPICLAVIAFFIVGCSTPHPANNSSVASQTSSEQAIAAEIGTPLTIAGNWTGEVASKPHICGLRIESSRLPCNGRVQFSNDQSSFKFAEANIGFFDVEGNHIQVNNHNKIEVTTPVTWHFKAGEYIATHTRKNLWRGSELRTED